MNLFQHFRVTSSQLAPLEENAVTILINSDDATAITHVDVALFRADAATDTVTFVADTRFTTLLSTYVAGTGRLTVTTAIPPSLLELGAVCHIIVVVYDAAGRVSSHLTPALIADYIHIPLPTLVSLLQSQDTGVIAQGDALWVAPYERLQGGFEVDAGTFNAAMSAAGLGNMGSMLQLVACGLYQGPYNPAIAPARSLMLWQSGQLVMGEGTVQYDESTERLSVVLPVQYSLSANGDATASTWHLEWTIQLRVVALGGNWVEYVNMRYVQQVLAAEEDHAITVKCYDAALYPTLKSEVAYIETGRNVVLELHREAGRYLGHQPALVPYWRRRDGRIEAASVIRMEAFGYAPAPDTAFFELDTSSLAANASYSVLWLQGQP